MSPLVSGSILPFRGQEVTLGRTERPFAFAYISEVSNKFGLMKVNDVSSGNVIDLITEKGVITPSLRLNDTLTIDSDGKLGVRERILTKSNLEFSFSDPLHFELDQNDQVGGHVQLKYDPDDFEVAEGKLRSKEMVYKGFGAVKIAGLSEFDDLLDEITDDEAKLPKAMGIRVQTSDDLTQISGKLQVRPKGLGQIPYYTLSGFGADEFLYYNSVANTLSVPRILLQTRFVLAPNEATSQAYVSQFIQAMPGGGIDVLPEIQGTGRREIRVRVDPSGCIMNDPSMAGALDVRCDNLTLVKKAGILSANYMGDEDGDIVVTGNMIRSITTFAAPLVKTGNVVSLNLLAEAPDLTYAAGTLTCNIDVSPTGGLIKTGPLLSLAPEKLQQLDDATQELTDQKEALENVNDQLTQTTQKVNDAVSDITDVKSGLENMAGQVGDLAENIMSTAAQIGTAAAAGTVGGGISSGLALTAAGKLAKDGVQNLISANAAKIIGGGLAAASLAGVLGGILGSLSGRKIFNTYVIGDQGISNSGVPEGETEPVWGYSISQGYNWDPVKYNSKQTSPMTIGGMLGTSLAGTLLASTSPYTGQLTIRGGVGIDGSLYASGDAFVNTNQKVATEAFVNTNIGNKGFITSAALTPYLLSTTAASTYLTQSNAASLYQPVLSVGANLTKTESTISLNPDVSIATINVGEGVLQNFRKGWVNPVLTAMGGNTFSASSNASSDFNVRALFDNAQRDRWVSAGGYANGGLPIPSFSTTQTDTGPIEGAWVQINAVRPVIVNWCQLRASSFVVGRSPKSWTLLGSNDGLNWKAIDTQTGISWSGVLQYKAFSFVNTVKYSYFRFVFTSLQGNEASVSLNRVQLTGYYEEISARGNSFTFNDKLLAVLDDLQPLQSAIDSKQPAGDYTLRSYVDQQIGTRQPTGDYTLKSYVDGQISTRQPTGDYTLKSYVDTQIGTRQPTGDYTLKSYVDTLVATKQNTFDLSAYSTTSQMNSAIASALTSYSTTTQLNALLAGKANTFSVSGGLTYAGNVLSVDLSPYVSSGTVTTMISDYANSKGEITTLLNGYYTKSASDGLFALKTEVQPINAMLYNEAGVTYLKPATGNVLSIHSPAPQNYSINFRVGSTTAMQVMSGGINVLGSTSTSSLLASGGISLTSGTSNLIHFAATSPQPPSFGTRSLGTKLVLHPALTSSQVDYAMGVQSYGMWWSLPQHQSAFGYYWYMGTTSVMTLTNSALTVAGAAMASQPWVNSQGFLKSADLASYATQTYVNSQGFLKTVPSDISINTLTVNQIYSSGGVAPPQYGSRSAGTKMVLWSELSPSRGEFALGISPYSLWSSVPGTDGIFRWYHGLTETLNIRSNKTNVYNQLHVRNTSITKVNSVIPWSNDEDTSAFEVDGASLFNGPIILSCKNQRVQNVGAYRWMTGSSGTWNGYTNTDHTGNVAFMMGASRMVINGGEINIISDRSRKENIKPIENSLDALKKIPAVTFNHIGADKKTMGFIAQDVAKVYPELVDTFIQPDNSSMLMLNQMALIAALWKQNQEQQEIIEDLVRQVRGLINTVQDARNKCSDI
jgi:Chaperone of endosialidase